MNIDAAIDGWLAFQRRLVDLQGLAASTLRKRTNIARRFRENFGETDLALLSKSHLDLYVAKRRQTCAPVTLADELATLQQFLTWCVDEQHRAQLPRFPTVQVPNVETSQISDAAITWILEHMAHSHAEALEFMALMGLSPHELERIETQDNRHDPEGPMAHRMPEVPVGIYIGGRPDFAVKQPSRRRWLPLSGRAMTIWVTRTFGTSPTHRPFPKRDALEKALQRLRLEYPDMPHDARRVTPKVMRSWFASKVANDHPEKVLQKLMGHAPGSPVTRKHYVRSTRAECADAMEGLKI